MNRSRTQLWLEGLGDWAWPGSAAPELPQPPAWVPPLPPALQTAGAGAPASATRPRATPRGILIGGLLSALAAVAAVLALRNSPALDAIIAGSPSPVAPALVSSAETTAVALPALVPVSQDGAGSSIDHASFSSVALPGEGSFYVYLPPGFASTTRRYPVLYLLHGRNGHANAFLEIGIQRTLDQLIGEHAIAPMIAVMIQDRSTLDNWRDVGSHRSASYVVEVQELVDRMLPTIPTRAGRAIAGSSMGGFGAMHVALANPYRFSVVESWLGFFNNLEGELLADGRIIRRVGLQAYLYGAEADPVALPEEDPQFAARLRAAGAQAQSAVFPGGHSLEKVQEHLEAGLLFAGRSLLEAQRRAAGEEAQLRAAQQLAQQRSAEPAA